MEADEEDRVLFSTLGVTSANPEDIERDILAEAAKNDGEIGETEGSKEDNLLSNLNELSSTNHTDLYNKLSAVEVEIKAVASSIEQVKNFAENENHVTDDQNGSEGGEEDKQSLVKTSHNGLTLQHALAADRLRSLKKTKARIEKEISNLCKDDPSTSKQHEKLIRNLVKEEPKRKLRLKEVQPSKKPSKKRQKIVSFDDDNDFDAVLNAASAGFVETERDELVRKGILTPFHKLKGFERKIQQSGPSNGQNSLNEEGKSDDFASSSIDRIARSISEAAQARPTTKLLDPESLPKLEGPTRPFQRLATPLKVPQSLESAGDKNKKKKKRPSAGKKWRKKASAEDELFEKSDEKGDGVALSNEEVEEGGEDTNGTVIPSLTLEGGLKIPETIFDELFDYQKVGVQWLWELHCQRAGGIIGDEMGLGKTIQVLSFLGALHFSNMYKPSIIICPVTLLRQWRREARKWYPKFHVELLHDSAQDPGRKKNKSENSESDYESEELIDSESEGRKNSKSSKKWGSLINRVLRSPSGLLITTYEQLRLLGEKLLDVEWGYAVLDEGHRIRNPNAEVTLVCKQLQTVHRIIMTGAPIQNKLSELWSLFDFVFPGKLGVLPVFESEFAVPISVGGYANASPLQVSTAYRCAVVLRDLIMPYLLRRMKADVNAQLTKKTEHVLFCSLTDEQRSVYRAFLASTEVEQIFNGSRNSLYGIDVMRKICNHPDLLEREHASSNPDYGNPERSGKMKVVEQVLKVWKEQGHRVLLFAQTQQMLEILENFAIAAGYNYRRMDGLTPVRQRMTLIDEFNDSGDVFIFILTTKVGGLGTNLTGANRVIIFDPDWNPSTDMQARERAWRIGQTKDVTVYRLITRGTIEEKVYHRQIYKHFLTNKILKNPQQRRFFKARDMKDLFTLNEGQETGSTETFNIFSQLSGDVDVVGTLKDGQDKKKPVEVAATSTDSAVVYENNDSNTSPSKKKGKEKADHSDGGVDEETNILRSLFDANGIHSAMNHDVIMNANDEEKMKLEEQASQVAQRAAEALRLSRMQRSQTSISVPTWTGKSGAAGAPSFFRPKFGSTLNTQLVNNSKRKEESSPNGISAGASSGKALSSAQLLAKIRGNQASAVGDGIEHQFGLGSSSSSGLTQEKSRVSSKAHNLSGVQPEILIRQICTFIQQRGGKTESVRIVDHFRDKIPSKDLPLFKNLLKEIAILEKGADGSWWVLKPDYQ